MLGPLSREQRAAGQLAERHAVERMDLQRRLRERDQRAAELERQLVAEKRRSAKQDEAKDRELDALKSRFESVQEDQKRRAAIRDDYREAAIYMSAAVRDEDDDMGEKMCSAGNVRACTRLSTIDAARVTERSAPGWLDLASEKKQLQRAAEHVERCLARSEEETNNARYFAIGTAAHHELNVLNSRIKSAPDGHGQVERQRDELARRRIFRLHNFEEAVAERRKEASRTASQQLETLQHEHGCMKQRHAAEVAGLLHDLSCANKLEGELKTSLSQAVLDISKEQAARAAAEQKAAAAEQKAAAAEKQAAAAENEAAELRAKVKRLEQPPVSSDARQVLLATPAVSHTYIYVSNHCPVRVVRMLACPFTARSPADRV